MKEGLHPEYYQATVTCNCGNTCAIHSTPASRRLPRPVDVSISSTENTAWERLRTESRNRKTEEFRGKRLRCHDLNLFY